MAVVNEFFVAMHHGSFRHHRMVLWNGHSGNRLNLRKKIKSRVSSTRPESHATPISLFWKLFCVLTQSKPNSYFSKGCVHTTQPKIKNPKLQAATQNTTFWFSNHSCCSQATGDATTCDLSGCCLWCVEKISRFWAEDKKEKGKTLSFW